MHDKNYYLKCSKLLINLMQHHKLYNSRQLHKLIREIEPKINYTELHKILAYCRSDGLLHYDNEYVSVITYWRKIR